MADSRDITRLLHAASDGDHLARDALFEVVYQELHAIARSHRNRWSGNHTLDTSALINEAYLKLSANQSTDYRDRNHFFATASRAMRQVLLNYAERFTSAKRGSNAHHVTLSGVAAADHDSFDNLLQMEQLLEKLESDNPRLCRLFECRVFGGMTIEETAGALGVSSSTVKRDWSLVSAWVFREIQGDEGA